MHTEQIPQKKELIKLYIGKKFAKFSKQLETPSKLCFSWAGFFLGVYWLLYRKMYLYAICLYSIGIVLNLVVFSIGLEGKAYLIFCLVVNILVSVFLGIYGQKLYLHFVEGKVKKYMAKPDYSPEFFASHGGVTWGVPLMALLIFAFYLFTVIAPILMPQPQPALIHIIEWN